MYKKHLLFINIFLTFYHFGMSQLWDSLGTGTYGESKHFTEIDGKLYVGGIDTSNGVSTFNLATWDGQLWESVGGGIDGYVYSIIKHKNRIYVGGSFDYAGGPYIWPNPKIYDFTVWDGNQYTNLGFPNMTAIHSLASFQNEVYIGTSFVTINNNNYYGILKYNDSTYSSVGVGLSGFPMGVEAMIKYDSSLIVGGNFSNAGSLSINNIARWDGVNWTSLGAGFNAAVRGLYVDSTTNTLYACGSFTQSDTLTVNHVARWDGNQWQNLGSGLPTVINTLCFYKGQLYAGGHNTWGLYPSTLYKWDGFAWAPIIPGPLGNIYTLKVYQDTLYVGGGFNNIGNLIISGMAKYTDTTTVSLTQYENGFNNFEIYPNPNNGDVSFKFHDVINTEFLIEIFDIRGSRIFSRKLYSYDLIDFKLKLRPGEYICKLSNKGKINSKKFIVSK